MNDFYKIIRKCNFDTKQFYDALFNWLQGTERILNNAIQKIDVNGFGQITPSIDIGLPDDIRRISGGFLTGCYTQWNCEIPFVPVDTTVGVCSSSVYKFSEKLSNFPIEKFQQKIEYQISNKRNYYWNFNLGNHFIILAEDENNSYLIMHSSASEFKRQLDVGLYPMPNNWYWNDLKIYTENNRYIRYITGKKAEKFWEIAVKIPQFNIERHNFIAELFALNLTKIDDVSIHHHYGMPSQNSINIGCYITEPNVVVPIFSSLGQNIFLYLISPEDPQIDDKKLIPHGWGKTYPNLSKIEFDQRMEKIQIADNNYPINSDDRIKGDIRKFCDDPTKPEFYFNVMSNYFKGSIQKVIKQNYSYSKHGILEWNKL